MATYSGFWNEVGDQQDYSLLVDRNPLNRKLMKALRRKSTRVTRAVLDSISTSNSVAAVTYNRVQATPASESQGTSIAHGGVRTIEEVTLRSSGNATAAEVADVHTYTQYDSQPTYPGDIADVAGGKQMGENIAPKLG